MHDYAVRESFEPGHFDHVFHSCIWVTRVLDMGGDSLVKLPRGLIIRHMEIHDHIFDSLLFDFSMELVGEPVDSVIKASALFREGSGGARCLGDPIEES